MATQDHDLVVHRQHDPADRLHQLLEGASREVAPADRSAEDEIAGEQDPIRYEDTMTRCVAGCVPHGHVYAAERQLVVVGEIANVRRNTDVELV